VRAGKKQGAAELAVLERARAQLDAGRGLSSLELDPEERPLLAPVFGVSLKPSVVVVNVSDALLPDGRELAERVGQLARERGWRSLAVSAQLELELAELPADEASEMRVGYGLPDEPSLGRVARAVWDAGGLITFFTAGEPEARAWPCERDSPAPVAAGVIHSDFQKNFIRAEVTSVDELVAAGSMEALRSAGKLRLEGRDYGVRDGDVVFFRVGR
jgi:ribosome-binding ATPase YchF (GTP1/OBG family)